MKEPMGVERNRIGSRERPGTRKAAGHRSPSVPFKIQPGWVRLAIEAAWRQEAE